jgi:hypothetical protein
MSMPLGPLNDCRMTSIDPILRRKYEETEYRVESRDAPLVLRVGRASRELAHLFRDRGVASAAFVSAFNPYSQPSDEAENAAANQRLEGELRQRRLVYLRGVGSDPQGNWREPSFLVLGITREEAEALGRAYRQNAIVFADADALPELVFLR